MEKVIDVLINMKHVMEDGSLITITHFYFMLGISMVTAFFLTILQKNSLILNFVYFVLITSVVIMLMMLMMAFTLSYQEIYPYVNN